MSERLSTGLANALLTSWATLFTNGVMEIYTGTQPATSDLAETGTLLVVITKNGDEFIGGQPTNGLNFGTPVDGVMDKAAAEVWTGLAIADGVAGWVRFYDNTYTKGASTTAKRFDGAVSTLASAELQMSNTTLITGGPVTINSFPITQPRA